MLKHYQLLFADNYKYRHKFYLYGDNSAVCCVLGHLKQLRIPKSSYQTACRLLNRVL